MKVTEIQKECKAIADKHKLETELIEIQFRQHYGKYVGKDSPLYIGITCFHRLKNGERTNFSIFAGMHDKEEFTLDVLLSQFETECRKQVNKSLPKAELQNLNKELSDATIDLN